MQLSPARGRLLPSVVDVDRFFEMQLSPARGRLPIRDAHPIRHQDAAYPREGTVTMENIKHREVDT